MRYWSPRVPLTSAGCELLSQRSTATNTAVPNLTLISLSDPSSCSREINLHQISFVAYLFSIVGSRSFLFVLKSVNQVSPSPARARQGRIIRLPARDLHCVLFTYHGLRTIHETHHRTQAPKMDFIQRAVQALPNPETSMLVITTAVTTASLYAILNRIVYPRRPAVLRGPLGTQISPLSAEEKSRLLYPPDYFPGARDVPTPYGSVRCCTCPQASQVLPMGSCPLCP